MKRAASNPALDPQARLFAHNILVAEFTARSLSRCLSHSASITKRVHKSAQVSAASTAPGIIDIKRCSIVGSSGLEFCPDAGPSGRTCIVGCNRSYGAMVVLANYPAVLCFVSNS
jgi:hypothetical protein